MIWNNAFQIIHWVLNSYFNWLHGNKCIRITITITDTKSQAAYIAEPFWSWILRRANPKLIGILSNFSPLRPPFSFASSTYPHPQFRKHLGLLQYAIKPIAEPAAVCTNAFLQSSCSEHWPFLVVQRLPDLLYSTAINLVTCLRYDKHRKYNNLNC